MDVALIALGVYRMLLCLKAGALLSSLPLLLPQGSGLGLGVLVVATILLPFLGYQSDRIGQRRFILLCELGSALIMLGIPYLPKEAGTLILLPIGAAIARITYPITLAGAKESGKKGLTLGLLKSLGDIALLAGAVLGSSLLTLGPAPLYTLAGLTSLVLLPTLLLLPDTKEQHGRGFRQELSNALSLPLLSAVVWYASGALVEPWWDPLATGIGETLNAGSLSLITAFLLLGATVSAGILLDMHGLMAVWVCMLLDAFFLLFAPLTGNFTITGLTRLARIIPLSLQGIYAPYAALTNKRSGPGITLGIMGSLMLITETIAPLLGPLVADSAGYTGIFWLSAVLSGAAFLILKYY